MPSPLAEAAKAIRADIRILAAKGLLPPHPDGITFRVRSRTASLMQSVDVELLNVPQSWAYDGRPGGIQRVAPALLLLKDELRKIAARHWQADGVMTFTEVQVDAETMTSAAAA